MVLLKILKVESFQLRSVDTFRYIINIIYIYIYIIYKSTKHLTLQPLGFFAAL